MQKNAAAKNRHSTLWGIACRMIFYSSSPKPHVAQILGGKLWAEIRNAATSTTHLGHNLGLCLNQGQQNNRAQAPYMSRALLHTPLVSPCGGTFKRRSTTDLKCTYAIFEVKCLACCCLFRTKIRRCYPSVSRDGKSLDQCFFYIPEVAQNAADRRKEGCIHWHEDSSDQSKCTKPLTEGALAVCRQRSLLLTELNRLQWE